MSFKAFLLIFIISFSFSPIGLVAQTTIADEIDQDVWSVFKESFSKKDATVFNQIHTEDVVRITANGIKVGAAYRYANIKSFANKKSPPRIIDFRHERRIHESDIAYEIGYYKITRSNGTNHYGRFSVLLKKIDGRWRIAQDWDTDDINGHKVGRKDWDRLAKK